MEQKFYGMQNDYMFRAVLQKNKEVLKNLVAVLLEIDVSEIKTCEIENPIELGEDVEEKECILDIKLILNNDKIVNIEMQNYWEAFWTSRSLFYWARSYAHIDKGHDYGELLPTVHIGIINFNLFPEHSKFLAEYRVLDVEDKFQYSDMLQIKVLNLTQLDKAIEEHGEQSPLVKWSKVFRAKTMEEIEKLANKDEVLEDMVVTMKQLSEDEKIRMKCEAKEEYERRLATARQYGMEVGMEAGIQQGIEQGRNIERENTIRERERADAAEEEIRRLLKLISEK